jgi:hypothetical protein
LSASVPSRHTQFSAAFITNIAESNFRYTQRRMQHRRENATLAARKIAERELKPKAAK